MCVLVCLVAPSMVEVDRGQIFGAINLGKVSQRVELLSLIPKLQLCLFAFLPNCGDALWGHHRLVAAPPVWKLLELALILPLLAPTLA
jgi:hypothetical protein